MKDGRYRRGVGIALFNSEGRVFLAKRRLRGAKEKRFAGYDWQMPQGGIEPDEAPLKAALRELAEETGVTKVSLLSELDHWLAYEFPSEFSKSSFDGKYLGQKQRWFALRLEGPVNEINLSSHAGDASEFVAWRWAALDEAAKLVIPFKRATYEGVARAFSQFAQAKDAKSE